MFSTGARAAVALVLVAAVAGCGSRQSEQALLDAAGAGVAVRDSSGGVAAPVVPGGTAPETTGGVAAPAAPGVTTGQIGAETAGTSPAPGAGAGTGTTGKPTAKPGAAPNSAATPGGQGASCASPSSTVAIASVGMQSGVIATAIGGGPRAVQAWVQAQNAKGGVNCHPVKYIVADDGGDPAKHTSLVQQLVEQQNVIAFVQMNSPLAGHSSVKYLESKGVPVIGSEGASPWFYESSVLYPQAASGDDFLGGSIIAVAQQAKTKGMTKIGSVACIEATICSRVNQVMKTYADRVPGISVAYTGSASLTATDYTSQCLAAKNAGVEALVAAFDYTGIQRVAKSCASVNFRPMYGTISEAASPELSKDKYLDGMVIATNTAPWFAPGIEAISLYDQVMRQFDVTVSADSAQGWVSALLFAEAAKKLPANPTSKDIVAGLHAVKNNDLGGTTGKLTFRAGAKHTAPLCYFPVQATGGTWVSLNSFKRVCV